MRGSETRLLFFATAFALTTASLVSACTEDAASPAMTPERDAAADEERDAEDVSPIEDAGTADTGKDATTASDANGPGEAGTECTFNRECQQALRCSCEDFFCSCQVGPRGTGRNGLDPCDSGDQCASSVCVDGPSEGESICSGECTDPSDCVGKLPRCLAVSEFPSSICVRAPKK